MQTFYQQKHKSGYFQFVIVRESYICLFSLRFSNNTTYCYNLKYMILILFQTTIKYVLCP